METIPQDDYLSRRSRKKDNHILLSSHRSRLFQKVCDQMSDPLIISDAAGKIVYANSAYYRSFGYAQETIIGEHFSIIFPSEYRVEVEKQYEKFFHTEKNENSVNTFISERKGNIVYVEMCYTFIYKRRKKVGMISVIRDITSQTLRQKNREKYLTNAYHALKSPLATISTYLQLIEKHSYGSTEKNMSEYLAHVIQELYALNTLIDEWLDFTEIHHHRQSYTLQLFSMDAFLREEIQRSQKKTNRLTIILKHTIEKDIIADKEQIGKVFQAFLSNGITASSRREKIIVSSKMLDEYIRISFYYGMGITKEEVKSLFENHVRVGDTVTTYTTEAELHNAKEIIHDHGGRIGVMNNSDGGNTFFFELPIHKNDNMFFSKEMHAFSS